MGLTNGPDEWAGQVGGPDGRGAHRHPPGHESSSGACITAKFVFMHRFGLDLFSRRRPNDLSRFVLTS